MLSQQEVQEFFSYNLYKRDRFRVWKLEILMEELEEGRWQKTYYNSSSSSDKNMSFIRHKIAVAISRSFLAELLPHVCIQMCSLPKVSCSSCNLMTPQVLVANLRTISSFLESWSVKFCLKKKKKQLFYCIQSFPSWNV